MRPQATTFPTRATRSQAILKLSKKLGLSIILIILSFNHSFAHFSDESDPNVNHLADYASVIKKYNEDLRFVQNQGQYNHPYKYVLTNNMLNLGFDDKQIMHWVVDTNKEQGFAWSMKFEDSNSLQFQGLGQDEKFNETILRGQNQYQTLGYKEMWSKDVYDGIDLRYYSRGEGLVEFDLLVNPQSDPGKISYTLEGIEKVSIAQDGRLQMQTPFGDLFGGKPYVYQIINGKEIEVESKYKIEDGSIGFSLGSYDINEILVIDPIALDWSTFINQDPSLSTPRDMKVTTDGVYVLGTVSGSTSSFPVSPGVFSQLGDDATNNSYLAKFDVSGNLLWSTTFGGDGLDNAAEIEVDANGNVTAVGTTQSSNFPVTPGAFQTAPGAMPGHAFAISFDTNGQLNWSTYIAGSGSDGSPKLEIVGGSTVIALPTTSMDLPTSAGAFQSVNNGFTDQYIISLDNADGSSQWSTYFGGTNFENSTRNMVSDGTNIYFGFETSSTDMFTSANAYQSVANGGGSDAGIVGFDVATGNLVFSTYVGGDGVESLVDLEMDGNTIIVGGYTSSMTGLANPSAPDPTLDGQVDGFIGKLNIDGSAQWVTYVGGDEMGARDYVVDIEVDNGDIYFLYQAGVLFPTTPGAFQEIAPLESAGNAVVGKVAPDGVFQWATFYSGEGNFTEAVELEADNGLVYVATRAEGIESMVTTNDAVQDQNLSPNNGESIIGIFTSDGNLCYSSFWGGPGNDYPTDIEPYGGDLYYFGRGDNSTGVTQGAYLDDNGSEITSVLTKFTVAPNYSPNTITSPMSQTTCQFGLAQIIDASTVEIDQSNLPVISYGGMTVTHPPIEAMYLWQESESPTGPWTDLAYGILEDFLPFVGGVDMYYRRQVIDGCSGIVLNVSDVAAVLVNANTAPDVDAGGAYYTCPNISVDIGGAPTADGEAPPFTYTWDMAGSLNDASSPNPTATVPISTIFTLTVTDQNGCSQIDQSVVTVVQADAGPDVGACEGTAVRIGTAAIPGLAGASYTWSPTAGLDDPNIAMPLANPASPTTYTLTLEIPLAAGGVCSTTDDVLVTPVASPGVDFAGPDQTICFPATATIGTNAPGYTYQWAPGNYLTSSNTGTTTFDYGDQMPEPNPFSYVLRAESNGCTFYDDITMTVLWAEGGDDVCGPRYIGGWDHGDLNPTYTWTKVSGGTSDFIGPTDTPFTTVSSSGTGTTGYQIDVSKNGVTCTDNVLVPPCGCVVNFSWNEPIGCPKLFPPNDTLKITASAANLASSNPNDFDYLWSPSMGTDGVLDNRTLNVITTGAMTYTVDIISQIDGSVICSGSIYINDPAWSPPNFVAQDHFACPGDAVSLGESNIPGYSYEWVGPDSFMSTESNPSVTPPGVGTFNYIVLVEDVASGCITRDTATVMVQSLGANAGPDWEVCDNAIVQLGTPDPSGGLYTYQWAPAAPWQNGTDANSAQPEVLMSTSLEFQLTVTNPNTGCQELDTAMVNVMPDLEIGDAPDITFCEGGDPIEIGPMPLPNVSYTWSPAAGLSCTDCANPLANPSTTTTYTVTGVFPGCPNQDTDQVTVTVPDHSFSLMGPVGFCPSSGGVSIGDDVPVGTSYAWSPATDLSCTDCQNPMALGNTETSYTVTVTFADGCTDEASIDVVPTANPNAGSDKSTCVNEPTTIGDAGNTGMISWSPSTGLSCTNCPNPSFDPPAGGTYNFTISITEGGCTNTDEVSVTVNEYIPPTQSPQAVCQGGCTELSVPFESGKTYAWAPSTGLSNPTSNVTIACPAVTTEYSLLIVDAITGCFASSPVVVTVADTPAPEAILADQEFCAGDPATPIPLTVNPAAGNYTYVWSPNTYLSNPFIQQPEVFPVGDITYFVTVTDNDNGCSSVAQTTIDVVECSSQSCTMSVTAGGSSPICAGDELSLTAAVTNGADPLMISWTGPDGFSSTEQNPVIMMATQLMSGDYTVSVIDADGCMAESTVNISVGAVPTLSIDNVECSADMTTYTISFSSDATVSSSAGTISGNQVIDIPEGTDVTVTATLGSCTTTMDVMAPDCNCPTVNPPTNPSNPDICDGDAIPELSVSVDAGLEAHWYDAATGGNVLIANNTAYTPSGPLMAGMHSYFVESLDPSTTCSSATRTEVILTINETPSLSPTATSPICEGDAFNLMAMQSGGVGPFTYTWTGPNTFTSTDQDPALFDADASSMAGDYFVTVTDGNGCSAEGTVNVNIDPTPSLTIGNIDCSADQSSYSVAFTSDGTVTATEGVVGATSITDIPAGTNVTITATSGDCNTVMEITAPDCSCPTVDPPTDPVASDICYGDDIPTLSVTAAAGMEVDWYADATGGTALLTNSTSFTPSGPLSPGAYSYYAESRDAASTCVSAVRLEVSFTIFEAPVLVPSYTEPVCSGETIFLFANVGSGTSPFDISWTGPNGFTASEADPTIENSTTAAGGDYTVSVIDANGCQHSAVLSVTVTQSPALTIDNVACAPDLMSYTVEFTSDDPVTATVGDVGDGVITNIPLGQDITVTAEVSPCSISFDVMAPECTCPMIFAPTASDPVEICDGDDIPTISASTDANFVIDWYDASMGGNLLLADSDTYTPAGPFAVGSYTYYAEAREVVSNCTSAMRTEVEIIVHPNPVVTAFSNSPVCEGGEIELSASALGGPSPFVFAWTGPDAFTSDQQESVISGIGLNNAGTYNVVFTDGNGCVDNSDVEVEISPAPTHPDITGICNNNNTPFVSTDDYVEFEVNPGGPTGGSYTLSISNGTISPSVGTYGVPLNVRLENNSAGSGTRIVTIASNQGPECLTSFTLTIPSVCSEDCPQGCYEIEIIRD